MPHLLMWVFAILTGWLSDYLISNGKLGILQQRRLFSTIGKIMLLLKYSNKKKLYPNNVKIIFQNTTLHLLNNTKRKKANSCIEKYFFFIELLV